MFKICARTVLELGAELISSDVIALYELIKNAFDAGSRSGAEIRFEIVLRRNDYLRFRQRALAGSVDLARLKKDLEHSFESSASPASLDRALATINRGSDVEKFLAALDCVYSDQNRVVVSDNGVGMSQQDLIENYLVIGTASRRRAIDAALHSGPKRGTPPPYLGEKGIGRLSAMRLGGRLTVETAKRTDERMNLLRIDWSDFGDLEAMLEEIEVAPTLGDRKPKRTWSGTRLVIDSLNADWTFDRVKQLGSQEFARLTDPFTDARQRPRLALYWNGSRVPVAFMDRQLLEHAHASVRGRFTYRGASPTLLCCLEARDLGFDHPKEVERREIGLADLESVVSGTSERVPLTALEELGDFTYEAYWFNRGRLRSIDSIGDRSRVRELQKKWSGILLFRDGFRVFPYGEDDDDWLSLDRRALARTGYMMNKLQFVGRVNISRLGNPGLVDQTNREGLRDCPEKQAFVRLLQEAVQHTLGQFTNDVRSRYRGQPVDVGRVRTVVPELQKRAEASLRRIQRIAPQSEDSVTELRALFTEFSEQIRLLQSRIEEVEGESRQMVQIAGVGLLVEVVAHELARSTENALGNLESLQREEFSDRVSGLLSSLRLELTAVSKRLRVLDPLSVSGRQRSEVFALGPLIEDVLSGRRVQFARHGIETCVYGDGGRVRIRAVKGMVVQIVENLLANSVYWLGVRAQRDASLRPRISMEIGRDPVTITYEDNGPGVASENRERIFAPFFSLKEAASRRGLGLYIARECAEYHGGTLELSEDLNEATGRLHRFLVTFPETVVR